MFKFEIETDNDSFKPDATAEVRRLLVEVAGKVDDGQTDGNIFDQNGNTVGWFELTHTKE